MHAPTGELMGGQALLRDYTTAAELKQLCELANVQVKIAHHFDAKFSDTVFTLLQKTHEVFIGTGGIVQKFVNDMATTGLNFIQDATAHEAELSASDGMVFAAGLIRIWEQITELITEASALKLMYEGAQKKFAGILEWVGKEVKEYLDTQSMADCMTFMDESFNSLRKFSDTFNVLPFVPVVVGMVITHHSMLTSLWVNVSHFPLKIFLLPLMSDATVASGQMALLSYMAQQSIAVCEKQAQSKPMPRTSTREMDPTHESDHGSNVGLTSQKLKPDMVGLMPSKKDQLEAQSSKTPMLPILPQDPSWEDTPPPSPLPSLVRKHNTKGQNTHPGSLVASLLAQFQQSQSQDTTPKNMPSKNTPVKDTPNKGEQMPGKKLLMPDKSAKLPIKKQWTGFPSSEQESETNHNKVEKSKKKKKKEPKSAPTVATDLEAEETEERQEKCQWVRKWKQELKELQEYCESHDIFLHTVPERASGSHTGYLESHILDAGAGFFFIKSFKEWQIELQKQSQGIGHNASSAHYRLQMLEWMYNVKLSTQYNVHTEYLVEVFKYPRIGNRIPTDTTDGYGSTPMIGLYGLMEPYFIVRITTMQSGVVGKHRKKKSMSKCYCLLCNYVVQNHPLINNHVCTHLHQSLLCTINGCFHIENDCNDMWGHVTRKHNIPSGHAVVLCQKSLRPRSELPIERWQRSAS